MQGRAQRIAGEVLLPQSRREFVDSAGRVLTDTLQHVDQIVVGVDLVKPTGDDQAVHDPDVFGPELGPTKHPIFSTERNPPQRSFEVGMPRPELCRVAYLRTDFQSACRLTDVRDAA